MTILTIAKEIAALPKARQDEVMDFVIFLGLQCGKTTTEVRHTSNRPLTRDAFIGMWADRSDMDDGDSWVRKVRRQEWSRRCS